MDFLTFNNSKLTRVTKLEKAVDIELKLVAIGIIRFDGALLLFIIRLNFLERLAIKFIEISYICTYPQEHICFEHIFLHIAKIVYEFVILLLAVHIVIYKLIVV